MFPYQTTTALITGASSGIGAAITRVLVAQGVPVFVLVAQQSDGLKALAQELRSTGQRVETLAIDLTTADASAQVRVATDRLGLSIDLLVNDAGIGGLGPFDQLTESPGSHSSQQIVALNVATLVALTREYLPGMVERKWGGVLNLGSTAAFQPVPYSAVYGASKAFVLSFSQALWAELQDRGLVNVRVACLVPGVTDTPFGLGHGEPRGGLEKLSVSRPEAVAQVALQLLNANAPYRVVGVANTVLATVSQLLPSPLVAGILARIRRSQALAALGARVKTSAFPGYLIPAAAPILSLTVGVLLWRVLRRR